MELVKKCDYENYLVGLLFPRNCRQAYFAVRAFNVEIAMIKDQIPRNTFHAGRIRFQFWNDTLDDIYSKDLKPKSLQHPVAQALSEAVISKELTRRWFERSLEAR